MLPLLVIFLWLTVLTLAVVFVYLKISKQPPAHMASSLANSTDQTKYFRYFSLIKYNPFADTGGEQSFILALLNGQKTGIIITSLHGRGVTRFYSKKIVNGLCNQELSSEEKQALTEALTQKS